MRLPILKQTFVLFLEDGFLGESDAIGTTFI
jgi:hypothetical protein